MLFGIEIYISFCYNKTMLVYRYLCEEEYNDIMNLKFDNIGANNSFKKDALSPKFKIGLSKKNKVKPSSIYNNFKYKDGEKYFHFFKELDAMEKMQSLYMKDGKDYYFCSFDIPFHILIKGIGKGYYETSGYDFDYDVQREYIVNVKDFNPKWIREVILDEKKHNYNQNNKDKNINTETKTEETKTDNWVEIEREY